MIEKSFKINFTEKLINKATNILKLAVSDSNKKYKLIGILKFTLVKQCVFKKKKG